MAMSEATEEPMMADQEPASGGAPSPVTALANTTMATLSTDDVPAAADSPKGAKEPASLATLPDELVLMILDLLNVTDLFTFEQTSKRHNSLVNRIFKGRRYAMDGPLYEYVMSFDEIPSRVWTGIHKLILDRCGTNLRLFSSCYLDVKFIDQLFAEPGFVNELALHCPNIEEDIEPYEVLIEYLKGVPNGGSNIKALSIDHVDDDDKTRIVLEGCPNIKVLYVAAIEENKQYSLARIANFYKDKVDLCLKVVHLTFPLIQILQNQENLETLNSIETVKQINFKLHAVGVDIDDAKRNLKCLLDTVTKLDVLDLEMDSTLVPVVVAYASQKVRQLELRQIPISDEYTLFNEELKRLEVLCFPFEYYALDHLADHCPPNLQELVLTYPEDQFMDLDMENPIDVEQMQNAVLNHVENAFQQQINQLNGNEAALAQLQQNMQQLHANLANVNQNIIGAIQQQMAHHVQQNQINNEPLPEHLHFQVIIDPAGVQVNPIEGHDLNAQFGAEEIVMQLPVPLNGQMHQYQVGPPQPNQNDAQPPVVNGPNAHFHPVIVQPQQQAQQPQPPQPPQPVGNPNPPPAAQAPIPPAIDAANQANGDIEDEDGEWEDIDDEETDSGDESDDDNFDPVAQQNQIGITHRHWYKSLVRFLGKHGDKLKRLFLECGHVLPYGEVLEAIAKHCTSLEELTLEVWEPPRDEENEQMLKENLLKVIRAMPKLTITIDTKKDDPSADYLKKMKKELKLNKLYFEAMPDT